jgi:hypothetical protein
MGRRPQARRYTESIVSMPGLWLGHRSAVARLPPGNLTGPSAQPAPIQRTAASHAAVFRTGR